MSDDIKAPERCPTCDREGCDGPFRPACGDDKCSDCSERRDCESHAVDWRARAIAAEARWAKVAPLIERLREAAKVARHDYATDDDATIDPRVTGHEMIDAVMVLLAATEGTP